MQRAAASSTPSTPAGSSQRAAKRQKLDDGSSATPVNAQSLPKEEETSQLDAGAEAFLARQAELAGDTKWSLNIDSVPKRTASSAYLNVVQRGYASIDRPNESDHENNDGDSDSEGLQKTTSLGRMSYGKFNKHLEKQQAGADATDEASSSGEGEEPSEEGEVDERSERPLQQFSHRQARHAADMKGRGSASRGGRGRGASDANGVNLSRLSSISNGGSSQYQGSGHRQNKSSARGPRRDRGMKRKGK